jgi:hypothetical protein
LSRTLGGGIGTGNLVKTIPFRRSNAFLRHAHLTPRGLNAFQADSTQRRLIKGGHFGHATDGLGGSVGGTNPMTAGFEADVLTKSRILDTIWSQFTRWGAYGFS